MDIQTVSFSGTQIGLIVRAKQGPNHDPSVFDQHADCILADGSPIGFYGNEEASMSGSGFLGNGMLGRVGDYGWMSIHRPQYVLLPTAHARNVVSTVLLIEVTQQQRQAFEKYWSRLRNAPGSFHLLGNNCATHASDAFVEAGILSSEIPGIDTPNGLYEQLRETHREKAKSYTGHIGFQIRVKHDHLHLAMGCVVGFDLLLIPKHQPPRRRRRRVS
jgi:hypothetical protein